MTPGRRGTEGERVKQSMAVAASPPGFGTQVGVEDDASVDVVVSGGDEDELDSPSCLAVALEVQVRIGLARKTISPVGLVESGRRRACALETEG